MSHKHFNDQTKWIELIKYIFPKVKTKKKKKYEAVFILIFFQLNPAVFCFIYLIFYFSNG